ncbi:CmpA/NrtA family ABC transporter substrate-binding protein [Pseudosulfitobacter pseudonitzschiae]|uniref:CmpA/NrtA family ABC transporter substrate-binding protein n=1 Tax=Pseudosulfitobacter pseudonitzschiae TaxID=1402135 RepID=UPI001AF51A15|nr:CmpA/NrtA family ABC transporter substrate-binding protein [Pseudosulfitobacter pseudonitzschiae]MBM1816002.1 ABC transporter substrate-binding protein [Pseudosulfitobacter pseudonitzschiae]MBM1833308.1 ABC transporter substrate-binding protein [Pseudosulfitobacter pseudonitzschiae]MBM1838175.1 ABC transporter substrate-binding protein [Pseudosulfitobacter pseudonitzschiae]MBM1842707.1 ABC transporter substrate-binding protein [Pseudosulfitobacter pseudonitzschiae]MBM1847573.1 ABC transport
MKHFSALLLSTTLLAAPAFAEMLELEKDELKLGFIKLTDMAPLAVAYENGYFLDEGLFVTLEAQANWKVLLDGVIGGQLDGAHMLAGQPLAATIGYGTEAHIITPFSMDLNGNGITVSNSVWEQMKPNIPTNADGLPQHPISASALLPVVESYRAAGKPFNMGMVFPVSTHNYELRYWLAAGGLNPGLYSPADTSGQIGADVFLSVTPPPQMPATLEAGTIDGYCVGEPWNQQAVVKGIGVPVITDYELWKNNPEKVFGITAEFAEKYPNTTLALTKALIRAAIWLDENENANREAAVEMLSRPEYVGADAEVIAASMTGTFEYEPGDVREVPDFNVFFRYNATYPFYSDAVWYLTQMRRWGQIAETKDDAWFDETARSVYRPDIYLDAARLLVDEGNAAEADFPWDSDGYKAPTPAADVIDGIPFDGKAPNAYIDSLPIGLKSGEVVGG